MNTGDIVVRKSYGRDITFKVIDIVESEEGLSCILKGLNIRIMADSPSEDLEIVDWNNVGDVDKVFNKRVKLSIKNILLTREEIKVEARKKERYRNRRYSEVQSKELSFGRPGKVLHIDSDDEYLGTCMKAYKQLSIEASGKVIPEKNQSGEAVDLIKKNKPDIVVITGHDAVVKGTQDFIDINNYKNSKYFVETVTQIRNYEPDYDKLVIFAGACQSCYEALLDAGANFASSPNRILIHCLDPVFVCEKVAYTNIEKVLSLQETVKNSITGIKGIGGLQTRGKYREGYPKSAYI